MLWSLIDDCGFRKLAGKMEVALVEVITSFDKCKLTDRELIVGGLSEGVMNVVEVEKKSTTRRLDLTDERMTEDGWVD